jgi:hypothetical protein
MEADMRKEITMTAAMVAAFLLFVACGGGEDPVTDDAAPADSDTTTLDEDALVPDVDTATPTKPGDDFNTPERNVLFEFKGLINTYDDVMSQTDT